MRPVVLWYRGHDLRVTDNVALRAAAALGVPVLPVFVWDARSPWTSRPGRAGCWRLHRSLEELQSTLRARYGLQAQLSVRCGNVVDSLVQLVGESGASAVFFNRCYDGHALETDRVLEERLALQGVEVIGLKSELLLEPWEVLRDTNEPFYEFHPYLERWLAGDQPPPPSPPPEHLCLWTHWERLTHGVGALADLHLLGDLDDAWRAALERAWPQAGEAAAAQALEAFLRERYPEFDRRQARCSLHGTSRLSAFVRFGELSPRQLYRAVMTHVGLLPHAADDADDAALTNGHGSAASRIALPPSPPRLFPLPVTTSRPCGASGTTYHAYDREDEEAAPPSDNNGDAAESERARDAHHRSVWAAKSFLKNMCLREFAYHLLFYNPHASEQPLLPEFRAFPWRWDDHTALEAWRDGRTGYPIVDAAVRELKHTGYLHNRTRFILAGFLTKYLLVPWQQGLRFLYDHLIDGDVACQVLGWQWTAGCHTDAFPFACIVNPVNYGRKEDARGAYVKRWLPELCHLPPRYVHCPWRAPARLLADAGLSGDSCYVQPVVDSRMARARARDSMDVMRRIFVMQLPERSLWTMIDWQQPSQWLERERFDDDGGGGGAWEGDGERVEVMRRGLALPPTPPPLMTAAAPGLLLSSPTPAASWWSRASSPSLAISDSLPLPHVLTSAVAALAATVNPNALPPDADTQRAMSPVSAADRPGGRRAAKGGSARVRRRPMAPATEAMRLTAEQRSGRLAQVARDTAHPFHCVASLLLQRYRLTARNRHGKHGDFVRLRHLKAELEALETPCPLAPPATTVAGGDIGCAGRTVTLVKLKRFLADTLGLEVTGQWDRRTHGGVRGPYVYGLVKRVTS